MTLVIIDMQPSFDACANVVEKVVEEIRRAIKKRTGIVVVEYDGCSPTHRLIQQAIRGYDRQVWVKKDDDCGSREVMDAVYQHRFWNKSWRFCGVNTCYCVRETIKGIIRHHPDARFEYAVKAMSCTCGTPTKCGRYFNFKAGLNKNHRIV